MLINVYAPYKRASIDTANGRTCFARSTFDNVMLWLCSDSVLPMISVRIVLLAGGLLQKTAMLFTILSYSVVDISRIPIWASSLFNASPLSYFFANF